MRWRHGTKKNRGQTALEYALVIGVLAVGVIIAGKKIFGNDGAASKLMETAVKSAAGTMDPTK